MVNLFENELFMTIFPYVIITVLMYLAWRYFINMLKKAGKTILGGIKKVGSKLKKGGKSKKGSKSSFSQYNEYNAYGYN